MAATQMKNTLAVGIAFKLHIKVFYNHLGPLMLDISLTYRSKYRFDGYAMPEVIITAE